MSKLPGNPAKVAMRVQSIRLIQQVTGNFAMLGEDTGQPPYGYKMPLPEWTVHALEGSVIQLIGSFAFEGFNANAEAGENHVFVRIAARYKVEYVLTEGEAFSDADLDAFARVNGQLNLQPYWREFVCSCLARAGLPPILIEPFNPVKSGLIKPKVRTSPKLEAPKPE